MSFQAYPKDPSDGLAQVIKYLNGTGDTKHLVAGVYDLFGFMLSLMFGDPNDPSVMSPEMMGAAFAELHAAMATSKIPIPDWIKPLLVSTLQSILLFLSRNKPAPG